ncbi:pentatricopeptide repeat-containing protein At1g08070, chloroplastic-like [Magnolia sinica]|uniref:pentatricopeptide repeat-containing protein At1g08070, chloroplastic-like n=1 Tax=Magnolia sinica TaxID=86752 RepID=UPI00265AB824|nr:pentatricopeptide repeat-containing protein At1g08070, chloroplastic-like [Magnolia sinica]
MCSILRNHSPLPTLPFIPRFKDQQSFSLILQQNPHLHLHHLKQIQAQLFHKSLHQDNILITKLISICALSGATDYATRLFESVFHPDLILCNSMLKAYTQNGLFELALHFYLRMLERGFYPDHYTLPYVLKACAGLSNVGFGEQVHGSLVKNGGVCDDVFVVNSLVDMYFKCLQSDAAMRVFQMIAEPNSTSWNIVVAGLLGSGDLESAKNLFDEMPERDVVSWNTLISALAKVGELGKARALFDEMPERNLVTWNALIAGFSQNGQCDEALSVFSQMLKSGVEPDNVTILTVVSAVGGAHSPDTDAVDRILSFARSSNSISVSTAVLNLYAKFGKIDDARKIFDEIPEKDLVTWNAMIGGYSQNQRPVEAIELFCQMQAENRSRVKPDGVTMVSLTVSCSQMGALGLGEWVHAYIEKNGIELDVFLSTALIDMYAKCGDLNCSCHLFWGLPKRDLACWNAMIKGLAIHGQGNEALEIFSLMERDAVAPNDITFVGLLSACSHGGLAAEGLELFDSMQSRYSIIPRIEHYGCVVDLLGRAGRLAEAYEFVKSMPVEPDVIVWGALLGACRSHQNVELAEEAARQLVELEPKHDGNYVLLSNVYASAGKWGDVAKVRAHMKAHDVRKKPGCSAVELGGVVHEFIAGDRSHLRSAEIYAAWDRLVERLKLIGYEPDTGALLRNLEEEDKEAALYRHSEKLALSFMLISSKDGSPIRIVKNLRICSDCHRAMELVSQLEEREIIVRDRNRFHHFNGGHCSCGGYW